MDECANCKYAENCKLGLYMINPCECLERTIRDWNDLFAPVVHEYQNCITGKWESRPLEEYYKLNPFMYE